MGPRGVQDAAARAVLGAARAIDQMGVDGRVPSAAIVASAATGVIFGVLPALVASDQRITLALHEESRGGTAGVPRPAGFGCAGRGRAGVFARAARGARALLIVSFRNLVDVAPGFRSDQLAIVRLSPHTAAMANSSRRRVLRRGNRAPRELTPGVQRVRARNERAAIRGSDARLNLSLTVEPWLNGRCARTRGWFRATSRTLGIRLVRRPRSRRSRRYACGRW